MNSSPTVSVIFVHRFCDDGSLVDTMRANGLNTVLCVGNGISQVPRAVAWAGFDVNALICHLMQRRWPVKFTPPAEFLAQLVGERSGGLNGNLKFVVGNLCDSECCPGRYDLVIERLNLRLYSDEDQPRALQAVANRLASPGIFFSESHDGGWNHRRRVYVRPSVSSAQKRGPSGPAMAR